MRVSLLEFLIFSVLAIGLGLVVLTAVVYAASHLLMTPLAGWPALSLAQSTSMAAVLWLVLWGLRAALSRD